MANKEEVRTPAALEYGEQVMKGHNKKLLKDDLRESKNELSKRLYRRASDCLIDKNKIGVRKNLNGEVIGTYDMGNNSLPSEDEMQRRRAAAWAKKEKELQAEQDSAYNEQLRNNGIDPDNN